MDYSQYLQYIMPVIVAIVTAWASFKWGRKKTKEEVESMNVETSEKVVALVNEQLEKTQERLDKANDRINELEIQMRVMQDKQRETEMRLDEKRMIIRAAYGCKGQPRELCPVLIREGEILEARQKKEAERTKQH